MRKLNLLFLLLFSLQLFGQDYAKEFNAFMAKGDSTNALKSLKNWEANTSFDPDLYISFFNYYAKMAYRSQAALVQINGQSKIKNQVYFVDSIVEKGFKYIDKGIQYHPDRLDMYFGKCYVLNTNRREDELYQSLEVVMQRSLVNKNKWKWTAGENLKKGEEFMFSSIQDYISQLMDYTPDSSMANVRKFPELILRYYPENVMNLSNLAVSYIFEKKYKKALVPLNTALNLSPKDIVLLNNLAYCYTELKNNSLAIEYYQKIEKFGDSDQQAYARHKIKELQH